MLSLTLLPHERQAPSEDVHEIGEPVWMRCTVELSDVHHIGLVFENSRLIIVYVEVVGCREDGHYRRKPGCFGLAVHAISASQ